MKTNYQFLRKSNNHRFNLEFDIQPAIGFSIISGVIDKQFVIGIYILCFSVSFVISKLKSKDNIPLGCPFDDECYNPNTPYLDNTEIPTECIKCGKWNSESCNTCKVINPQFDGV